jgi:hypothetical protein
MQIRGHFWEKWTEFIVFSFSGESSFKCHVRIAWVFGQSTPFSKSYHIKLYLERCPFSCSCRRGHASATSLSITSNFHPLQLSSNGNRQVAIYWWQGCSNNFRQCWGNPIVKKRFRFGSYFNFIKLIYCLQDDQSILEVE